MSENLGVWICKEIDDRLPAASQGLPSSVQYLTADKIHTSVTISADHHSRQRGHVGPDTNFSMVGVGVMKCTYIYTYASGRQARLQTITCDAIEELTMSSNAWKAVLDNEGVVRLRSAKVPALLAESTLLLCCTHQVLIPHALCCELLNREGACTILDTSACQNSHDNVMRCMKGKCLKGTSLLKALSGAPIHS